MPAISAELKGWRLLAGGIPEPSLRQDALSALDGKRGHAAGAAMFAILPSHRDINLLRLLVAYETIWDFLDTVHERAPSPGNGIELHRALQDALDPHGQRSDYYRLHPWREDGGYLDALVASCRTACGRLPGYQRLRPFLLEEARFTQVLALNHEPQPQRRDRLLQAWTEREFAHRSPVYWYEQTGAVSASLTIHALLALAADPNPPSTLTTRRVRDAYNPWISAATTMLDSYADQLADKASGDHSYLAHYPTAARAAERIRELLHESLSRAQGLPDPERHALIVCAMAALYLTQDSAASPQLQAQTRQIALAGGSLLKLLMPVLRAWRLTDERGGAQRLDPRLHAPWG